MEEGFLNTGLKGRSRKMQEDLFEKALLRGADLIRGMLLDYRDRIEKAFLQVDEDTASQKAR